MNGYKWPDKRGSMTAVETEGVQFTCEFCGEAYRSKVRSSLLVLGELSICAFIIDLRL